MRTKRLTEEQIIPQPVGHETTFAGKRPVTEDEGSDSTS